MALAAGRGTRLGNLTEKMPKPLLPVGGIALLDHALERLEAVTPALAVNAHHHADQVVDHVGWRAHMSVEDELLGTAGALFKLAPWISGRHVAVTNADAWVWPNPLPLMVEGWNGTTVRVSVVRDARSDDFGSGLRYSGCCLLPWKVVSGPPSGPAGLYEACWKPRLGTSELELIEHPGRFFDCGTPDELAEARATATGWRSA